MRILHLTSKSNPHSTIVRTCCVHAISGAWYKSTAKQVKKKKEPLFGVGANSVWPSEDSQNPNMSSSDPNKLIAKADKLWVPRAHGDFLHNLTFILCPLYQYSLSGFSEVFIFYCWMMIVVDLKFKPLLDFNSQILFSF